MKKYSKSPEFAGVGRLGIARPVKLVYGIEGSLKTAQAKCCSKKCLYKCGGPSLEHVLYVYISL